MHENIRELNNEAFTPQYVLKTANQIAEQFSEVLICVRYKDGSFAMSISSMAPEILALLAVKVQTRVQHRIGSDPE